MTNLAPLKLHTMKALLRGAIGVMALSAHTEAQHSHLSTTPPPSNAKQSTHARSALTPLAHAFQVTL